MSFGDHRSPMAKRCEAWEYWCVKLMDLLHLVNKRVFSSFVAAFLAPIPYLYSCRVSYYLWGARDELCDLNWSNQSYLLTFSRLLGEISNFILMGCGKRSLLAKQLLEVTLMWRELTQRYSLRCERQDEDMERNSLMILWVPGSRLTWIKLKSRTS